MSRYLAPANPKGLAISIHRNLGQMIEAACMGTLVPPGFLAGLIAVEGSRLDPNATRIDVAALVELKKLKSPLIFWRRSWNGITQAQLRDKSVFALVDLATSWGYTQILGFWSLRLNCTIDVLRAPYENLLMTVRLLHIVAGDQLKQQQFKAALRIWSTGSPDGRTFDPEYVPRAIAVMEAYETLTK